VQAHDLWIILGITAVALLYSSVGHGGASGYLAVLAFAGLNKDALSSSGLVLNLFVASLALVSFSTARYMRWSLAALFLAGSLPFAFLGGGLKVSETVYYSLLGIALIAAGLRMLISLRSSDEQTAEPPKAIALLTGALIGLLSGVVGVGGGIFLSPVAILLRWTTAKEASAIAALFIVGNSLAGLAGRVSAHTLNVPPIVWMVLPGALAGGLLGSYVGARKLDNTRLKQVLGLVLLVAAARLVVAPG